MRARGVEPLFLRCAKPEPILTEETGEAATDTTGSCGLQGVHTPSPFEKENSVGESGRGLQPEEVQKQMVMKPLLV
jgi:hypothetical protein